MKKVYYPLIIGIVTFLSFLVFFGKPRADNLHTSYEVYTLPVLYLDEGIDETQIDDIILAAPKLNGSTITVRSMSGAIFEFKKPGKKEDIYASRVAVNSDNTLTLTGTIIRDLCQYTEARTFTTCSNGLSFGRGSEVRLTDNHRLFNLKANVDRPNGFTASGAISFSGSGSFNQPLFATATIRDVQLGANPRVGTVSCLADTGQCYDYMAGAWRSRSGSNLINASESIAGKTQGATVANQLARTLVGTSGAPLFLQPRYLTNSGGSVLADGRIFMGSGSALDESTIGIGTSSGKFLKGRNYGNAEWVDVRNSVKLVNSGGLVTNQTGTGVSLFDVQDRSTSIFKIQDINSNYHVKVFGATPTSGGCGSAVITGNDTAGRITAGAGAANSCAVYFGKRYPSGKVSCTVAFHGSAASFSTTYTASGFTIFKTGLGSDPFSWICLEFP